MSTHKLKSDINVTWFCTTTCYQWLPLFELSDGYDAVYNWFRCLKNEGCHILAYVIMPNHLHCLIHPTDSAKSLNSLVANGKRFMAYSIVDKLRKMEQIEILSHLSNGVQENEKKKGKRHQVFRLSFDGRLCFNEKMVEQKMNYIHRNPVQGRWKLVEDYVLYAHSSAAFYELGIENQFITHYKNL